MKKAKNFKRMGDILRKNIFLIVLGCVAILGGGLYLALVRGSGPLASLVSSPSEINVVGALPDNCSILGELDCKSNGATCTWTSPVTKTVNVTCREGDCPGKSGCKLKTYTPYTYQCSCGYITNKTLCEAEECVWEKKLGQPQTTCSGSYKEITVVTPGYCSFRAGNCPQGHDCLLNGEKCGKSTGVCGLRCEGGVYATPDLTNYPQFKGVYWCGTIPAEVAKSGKNGQTCIAVGHCDWVCKNGYHRVGSGYVCGPQ